MKKKASLIALCALSLTAAFALAGCGASLDREIAVQDMTMKVPSNWVESSDVEASSLDLSRLEAPSAASAIASAPNAETTNAPLPDAETAGVEAADASEGANVEAEAAGAAALAAADAESPEAGNGEAAATAVEVGQPASQTIPDAPSGVKTGGTVMYRDVDEDNDDEYNAISVTHLPLTSCAAKTAQEAIALKQLQAEKEFGAINWDIDKEESSVIDGSQVTKYEYSFEKEIDHVTKKYEYKTIYVFNSSMCYEISVYGNAASVDDVVNSIEF